MRVGVLALQGDFAEHGAALRRVGPVHSEPVEVREVRTAGELEEIDGLVIPGGESTTIGKLLRDFGILEPLRRRVACGLPVLGTCAGAIVLAREVDGLPQPLVGLMDISVRRNAYGRQMESFEVDVDVPDLGDPPLRAIFIRAPSITFVGSGVRVLARLPDRSPVAARQGSLLALSFHPELTGDARMHRYFAGMVQESRGTAAA